MHNIPSDRNDRRRRPFPASVDIGDPESGCVIGLDVVQEEGHSISRVVAVLDAFEAAARAGMFSIDPGGGTISPIETTPIENQEESLRRLWKVAGVQRGAFRVLLNTLAVISGRRPSSIVEVRLSSPPEHHSRLSLNDVMRSVYPLATSTPPFPVVANTNLTEATEPVIRLEFERPLRDIEFDPIAACFWAWDRLVLAGGYLARFEAPPAEFDIDESELPQQTYLAEPTVIEHVLYEFIGESASFDALVNMSIAVHKRSCRLVAFEIE